MSTQQNDKNLTFRLSKAVCPSSDSHLGLEWVVLPYREAKLDVNREMPLNAGMPGSRSGEGLVVQITHQ